MILRDKADVRYEVNTGERDVNGNWIMATVRKTLRAEIHPMGISATSDGSGRDVVTTRYRVILDKSAELPQDVGSAFRMGWGDYPIIEGRPESGLQCDGGIERHVVRGRLHHYEFTTASVVG